MSLALLQGMTHTDLNTLDLEALDDVCGGFAPGGSGAGFMTGVANSYSQARASGQPTTRTPMVNSPASGPATRTPSVLGSSGGNWGAQAGAAIDSFLGQ